MPEYAPVPVDAAREIAAKYEKAIVIINAWDEIHNLIHTTTYGKNPENRAYAALGGEITVRALGGLREASVNFEDYRLAMARRLHQALKEARKALLPFSGKAQKFPSNARALQRVDKALAVIDEALAKADEILGS